MSPWARKLTEKLFEGMSTKNFIKSHPLVKKLATWALQAPHQYRPRWWIRYIVNPFVQDVSRKAIIRRRTRLDIFPYRRFVVGDYSIIEDFALLANACGDIVIGKKVLIGVGSKIIGPVTFGDNILLAQNVLISALNHDFDDITKPVVEQSFSVREIVVEDGAWIGGGVVITAGVRIGKNAVVGAGSVVTKDVPPYSVVVGNPARVVKQYNFDTQRWEKTNPTLSQV
jgi:acetyltransferase-like isoleucine patch superfamily enzyme